MKNTKKTLICLSLAIILIVACVFLFFYISKIKTNRILEKGGDNDYASLYGIWTITERSVINDNEDDGFDDFDDYDDFDDFDDFDDYDEFDEPTPKLVSDTSYVCFTISITPDGVYYVADKVEKVPDDNYYNRSADEHQEGAIDSCCPFHVDEDSRLDLNIFGPSLIGCDHDIYVNNGALVPIDNGMSDCSYSHKVVKVKTRKDPTDVALSRLLINRLKKYDYSERKAVRTIKKNKKPQYCYVSPYGYSYSEDTYDLASPFQYLHAKVKKDGKTFILNKEMHPVFPEPKYIISQYDDSYYLDFDTKECKHISSRQTGNHDETGFTYDWEAPLVVDDYYNIGYEDSGMTKYLSGIIEASIPHPYYPNDSLSVEEQMEQRWSSLKIISTRVINKSGIFPVYAYLLAKNNGVLHFYNPNSNRHILLQDNPDMGVSRATVFATDSRYTAVIAFADFGISENGLTLYNLKRRVTYYELEVELNQPIVEYSGSSIQFGDFQLCPPPSDRILKSISKLNGYHAGYTVQQTPNNDSYLNNPKPNPAAERYNQTSQELERLRREMEYATDPIERQNKAREFNQLLEQNQNVVLDLFN